LIRQDGVLHRVQAAPAGAGDGVGVDVLGAEHLPQHELDFLHAAHDVGLHVVGNARACEGFQDTRIGIAGARASSKGFGNDEFFESGHWFP
jgi:hypothetical protein